MYVSLFVCMCVCHYIYIYIPVASNACKIIALMKYLPFLCAILRFSLSLGAYQISVSEGLYVAILVFRGAVLKFVWPFLFATASKPEVHVGCTTHRYLLVWHGTDIDLSAYPGFGFSGSLEAVGISKETKRL